MKLRATIDLDFEAKDIMDAKNVIDKLEKDLKIIEDEWGKLEVVVKERRGIRSTKRSN